MDGLKKPSIPFNDMDCKITFGDGIDDPPHTRLEVMFIYKNLTFLIMKITNPPIFSALGLYFQMHDLKNTKWANHIKKSEFYIHNFHDTGFFATDLKHSVVRHTIPTL